MTHFILCFPFFSNEGPSVFIACYSITSSVSGLVNGRLQVRLVEPQLRQPAAQWVGLHNMVLRCHCPSIRAVKFSRPRHAHSIGQELQDDASLHQAETENEVAVERKDLVDTTAGQLINETLMILSRKHVENLALTKEDIAQAINKLSLPLSRSSASRIEIKYTDDHYHRGRGGTGRARSYQEKACGSNESNQGRQMCTPRTGCLGSLVAVQLAL